MQARYDFDGLSFSYVTSGDLPDLVRMLAKPSVCRYLFFGPNTKSETTAFFQPVIRQTETAFANGCLPEQHVFVIRRTDGTFVGNCALSPVAFCPGSYEVSYAIDDIHWRQGYGKNACRFLVEYGFGTLESYRLSASYFGGNDGSRQILSGCGFEPEGCQHAYCYKDDIYYDNYLMGLLKQKR